MTYGGSPKGYSSIPILFGGAEMRILRGRGGLKFILPLCRQKSKECCFLFCLFCFLHSYHGAGVFLPRAAGGLLCLLGGWELAAGFLSQRGLKSCIFRAAAWHTTTCFFDFNLEKQSVVMLENTETCTQVTAHGTLKSELGNQQQRKDCPGPQP